MSVLLAAMLAYSCGEGGCESQDPGMLRIRVDPVQLEGLTGLEFDVVRVDVVITPDLAIDGHVLTLATDPRTLKMTGFASLTPNLFGAYIVEEEGFITQIRFIIDGGTAQVGPETLPLRIPSSPQTGLKAISADVVVEIKDQHATDVTIALDPARSVIKNEGQGVLVKPVVKTASGALSGFRVGTYVPDRITVLFKETATAEDVAAALESVGGTEQFRNPYVPYYVVELPAGADVRAAQETLNSSAAVQSAMPDYVLLLEQTPNDPEFAFQWGLRNTGQFGGTAGTDIRAADAWNLTTGSSAVTVAVIDTGVDWTHLDLSGNMWVNDMELFGANGVDDDGNGFVDDARGWNFANNNNNSLDDVTAICPSTGQSGGHGTNVAGVIGARGNNGTLVAGVNWTVSIMPLKVASNLSGCISTSGVFNALSYAANNGAAVANLSIGGAVPSSDAANWNAQFNAAIGGLLVVAAAGNEGVNVDSQDDFWVFAEIANPQLIVVGAINDEGALTSFTNRGATSVDLGAPGATILTTSRGGGSTYVDGTSFSSPFTAGVAALVRLDIRRQPRWTFAPGS